VIMHRAFWTGLMGARFSTSVQYSIPPRFRDTTGAPSAAPVPTFSLAPGSFPACVESATPVLPMLCLTGCRVRRSRFSVFFFNQNKAFPRGRSSKGRSITRMGREPAVVSERPYDQSG
jgi:hypothetical protein